MSKIRHLSTISLGVILGAACLAGCGGESSSEPSSSESTSKSSGSTSVNEHTVSFFVDSALYGEPVKVMDGQPVARPAVDPSKEDDEDYAYAFDDWYKAGESVAYDFASPVVEDLDLIGKFDKTPIVYDLTVWVWGVGSKNGEAVTYVSEDESDRLEAAVKALPALEGKSVSWKYRTAADVSSFTSSVINNGTVDLVIGGANMNTTADPALEFVEGEGTKVKLGVGWTNNTARYAGVLAASDAIDDAKLAWNAITALGPDYAEFSKTTFNMTQGATETIEYALKEGDFRRIAWTSSDEAVAAVSGDSITAVAEGEATLTGTLGLLTYTLNVNVSMPIEYDLSIVVYKSHSNGNVYVSDADAEAMESYISEVVGADKEIVWTYVEGVNAANFNQAVLDNNPAADLVYGGSGIKDEPTITFADEAPAVLANMDWIKDSTNKRYVGVTEASKDAGDYELAKQVYDLLLGVRPDYEITLDKSEAAIGIGETVTINATAFGNVTWTVDDSTVASVEDGVVTGLKGGEATVTARDAAGHTANCVITVTEVAPVATYDINVLINTSNAASDPEKWMTKADAEYIKTALAASSIGAGKKINLVIVDDKNIAGVVGVITAVQGTVDRIDAVVCRDAFFTNSAVTEPNLVAGTPVTVDSSWGYNTGKVGVLNDAYAEHAALIEALVNLLSAAKPDAVGA